MRRGIDKRGESVALLGGLVALISAVVLGVLGVWTNGTSLSIWAGAFQIFGVVGVWLLCGIQLHQQRLLEEEKLELAELERMRREKLGGVQTIFEEEDLDQMEKLAMGRRMRTIERYLIPSIALIITAYHIAAGLCLIPRLKLFPPLSGYEPGPIFNDRVLIFFTMGIAFVSFMVSRYALGMSRLPQYAPLRAGGNFMFGASIINLAISVGILLQISGLGTTDKYVGYAIAVVIFLLAAEIVINFILDFYRPRTAGQIQRAFYDSRVLGMFSEPGGIIRNISVAVDYQFGFKVSETWFYKLLGRVVLPLLIVQGIVILALTCIVVVPPGHQAVIEHWGLRPSQTAKPGIHWTYPWPVDRVTLIPVERIQRIEVGFERESGNENDRLTSGPILWTREHFKKEYLLLVADRAASASSKTPINLVSMNMPVQWRVKPADAEVIRYYAQSQDAESMLGSLAFRELTKYAASADILDLLGKGGINAAALLRDGLQKACDSAGLNGEGLGIEIVLVGIGGVHPPAKDDVAKTYENVVGAYEKREATIRAAEGDAAMIRLQAAGAHWPEVYEAINAEDAARKTGAADLPQRTAIVEKLLREISGGRAREQVAAANITTLMRVFKESSDAEYYQSQLAAYAASPETYTLRAYLRMLDEGLRDIRKYVVVLDDPNRVVYDLDLKPPPVFDAIGAELSANEAKQP
jgi:membrane protease subunit HflK